MSATTPEQQTTTERDYAVTYRDFWRDIVELPDGTLNRDQIMRELHDYHNVMEQVSLAYDDVTDGRISKPNTAAHHVVAAVNERIEQAIADTRKEAAADAKAERLTPAPPAELTPEQQLAQQIIRKHGKGTPWPVIRHEVATVAGWDQLDSEQQARMVAEIDRLIGLATVTTTVSWPTAPAQDGEQAKAGR